MKPSSPLSVYVMYVLVMSRRITVVSALIISPLLLGGADSGNLADGKPSDAPSPSRPHGQLALKTNQWIDRQMQAAAIPGGSVPDSNFYIRLFYPPFGPERRAQFEFPERSGLSAKLSIGGSVCGWRLEKMDSDRKNPFDGFATLRSADAQSIQLWMHVRVFAFGDPAADMPYDEWVHHEKQWDALIYRARHAIRVVNKPRGEPNDPWVDTSDPAPGSARMPPEPPNESMETLRVRGLVQVQIGFRLPAARPLPEIDFYLTGIDVKNRRATFRFPGASGIVVEAHIGDTVCGWIIQELRQNPTDSSEILVVMQPNEGKGTIELWNRLKIPHDGPPLKLDAAKWARHQIESAAQRAKADGRLIVVEPPARP